MNLLIGCKDTGLPGFKTVDIDPALKPDYCCDAGNLHVFSDKSADVLLCSNILEHFPLTRTDKVLKEWHRVLKPNGKLYVSVPDFEFCARNYVQNGLTTWLRYHMYGDQKTPFSFHYNIFDWPYLSASLFEAGFSKVSRLTNLPFGLNDASALKDNRLGDNIALNCVAVK